ncbi:MAG: hypothetical protein ABWY94_12805 [Pseudoxanthomonas sp.]
MMWSRALAGVFPGFFLSSGLLGLVCWSLPGPWQGTLVPGIIAFFPTWMIVIGASFFFSTGRRAWAWLSVSAAALLGALWTMQSLQWIS